MTPRAITIHIRPVDAPIHGVPSAHPHYFTIVAGNGETVAVSQIYSNRSNARRAARTWTPDQPAWTIIEEKP